MYFPSSSNKKLIGTGKAPNLDSSSLFWEVIETLPDECYVSTSIVKLGLITDELESTDDDISSKFSERDVHEAPDSIYSPETLEAVRRFLVKLSDDLDENTKKVTGELCEATGLNRPPQEGASTEAVRRAAPAPGGSLPPFFVNTAEESPSKETENSEDEVDREDKETESDTKDGTGQDNEDDDQSGSNHAPSSSNDSDPDFLASGKEVTKKGGERKTGKNPFADTNMLKDTGLHQGGG